MATAENCLVYKKENYTKNNCVKHNPADTRNLDLFVSNTIDCVEGDLSSA